MSGITVRDLAEGDLEWAASVLDAELAGRWQARRGELVDVLALPGLVAELEGRRVGLLAYRLENASCEIEALIATTPGMGIGTALVGELRRRTGDVPIRVVHDQRQPARDGVLPASRVSPRRGTPWRGRRGTTKAEADDWVARTGRHSDQRRARIPRRRPKYVAGRSHRWNSPPPRGLLRNPRRGAAGRFAPGEGCATGRTAGRPGPRRPASDA